METPENVIVYENAPIVLAIIQFRYEKIEGFDAKKIREIGIAIKKDFPNCSDNILQNFKLDPKAETKISIEKSEINGVLFQSENKKRVLEVGTQKFTLEIQDGKYPGWESFSEEIKKYWNLFSPSLTGLQLIGLSTRFINRINLPNERFFLSKYFNTYIHNPTDGDLGGFQMRYTSLKDKNLINVTHTLEQPIEDKFPYFFDIDVIRIEKIANDEKIIWDIFDNLRKEKNAIFNNTLTEEAKKLIK